MTYTPKTWVTGETIEANELNHMEQGIAEAVQAATGTGTIGTQQLADGAATAEKIAAGAVTSEKLGADVLAKLDNKADIDGSYEGMTVGNAEQLVSSVGIEDQTPYNFRTSGGSTEIGDREELNAVVGVSVPWNQLAELSGSAWSLTNASISFDNTEIVVTKTTSSAVASYARLRNVLTGHRYFVCAQIKNQTEGILTRIGLFNTNGSTIKSFDNGTTSYLFGSVIVSPTSNSDFIGIRQVNGAANGNKAYAKDVVIMDLTLLLGSTIADYIYSLEQSSTGAGVSYFRKLFQKLYYAYNAGELLSTRTNLHRMVGFNAYNPTTGTAKVVGGNQYQITGAYTALSLEGTTITPDAYGKFTPSASGTLTVTGGNSTTTCVHLVWDGEKDGKYEPYEAHEYALSDITLRGILKLDANNNLYADGDRYLPNGTVERRYGERAYQSGDESLANAITDGTTTVYKLDTPNTETVGRYTQTQIVDDFGTEEFVDAAVEAGERDVAIPVGNETVYKPNLRAKLEMAPDSPDGDGDYIVRRRNGKNIYIPLIEVKELPDMPSEDGSYKLRCTVLNGTETLSWVSDS